MLSLGTCRVRNAPALPQLAHMTGDQWQQQRHQRPPHPQPACSEAVHISALELGPHPDAHSLLQFAMQRSEAHPVYIACFIVQTMGIEAIMNAAVNFPLSRRTVAHFDPCRAYTFLVVGFVAGHAGCETKGMRFCQCCGPCLLPESQSSDCDWRPCLEVGQTVLPALPFSRGVLG